MRSKEILTLGLGLAAALTTVQAQFAPVALTPDSFTYDFVVEKEATPPPARNTTATFDGGTNNTSNTLYEMGFNRNAGQETSGIPAPGTTVSNPTTTVPHTYTLPASYTEPNAFFIDATVPNATIHLTTPAPFAGLSLLATSGGGAGVLRYEITFTDDTKEIGAANLTVPDWFNGADPVLFANGRVNVESRAFNTVNATPLNPRLYGVDISLAETTKPVRSIYLERVSGGRVGVFAVSGATTLGGDFTPLAVSGYTYDMIVEAVGAQAVSLRGFTTGTVDGGANNNGNSWYEQGYNTAAPTTGLPTAGSTFTSASHPDHQYRMPAGYIAANNGLLISSAAPSGTLTPVEPFAASGLSFLGASGNGAITVNYTIIHSDASTQTGSITIPDWFNAANPAYITRGRLNVDNATFNNVNAQNPRLYGVDIVVNNVASPITAIDIAWVSGTGRTVIMGLSATSGAVFSLQPAGFTRLEGGAGTLDTTVTGTGPFTFQWEKLVNGQWVPAQNSANISGATSEDLSFSNITFSEFGDYRLRASNAAGGTVSRSVRVNVVSSKVDITIPGETVLLVGGNAPANEGVANAIDDLTSKYLNYGLDPNTPPANAPPFEGPVGLEIQLIERAVVDGLRIYTANDAIERDPVGYILQGSNDPAATPESFVTIATGNLNLPLERNANPNPPAVIDPLTMANQEVVINNAAGYQHYRLLFTSVRDNAAANSVQIAEVEFLGEYGAGAPQLSITRNTDGTITITSSSPGTLQSTSTLSGTPIPWGNDQPIDGSITLPATGTMQFFRVVQ